MAALKRHDAYVGLGSNAGDPAGNVLRALQALDAVGTVRRASALYRTRPWGKTDQPDFVNAVALVETELEPAQLLIALKRIEGELGRVAGERWGPRVIDLDILTYDEIELDEPGLRVPHPHLHERAFVLIPLAEIAPAFVPLRDALPAPEFSGVIRLPDAPPPASP